ncbi:MAG TPA: ABC transporter permease [Acidisphaera sp.]|nr:ABC transporter permease [Acidisphaera sp.]
MREALANIFWLGRKELRSFFKDTVLLAFSLYAFSIAVMAMSQNTAQEVHNASVAVVDEDHSPLSRQIARDFLPYEFRPAEAATRDQIDKRLDTAMDTFVVVIPPHFERDLQSGRQPGVQVNADATAATQAGIGAGYIESILNNEIGRVAGVPAQPVTLQPRILYNPNAMSSWFMAVMGIVNNCTMLAIILTGAAVLREREHGTMDHLLVMPLSSTEIVLAKIWANGLVITVAAGLSLTLVVQALLHIPVAGSVPLFLAGVALYLLFATSVGVLLATFARSMPQLGLLYMLVAIPLLTLSGSNTPLESMPVALQYIMEVSPSTHFVSFAQSILYRGAGLGVVWPEFVASVAIALLVLGIALLRFRRMTAQAVG